ncbi:hypothetical protein HKCCE3408_04800 [Rhodobacterales bacterium HKCCE3408]|nr:hypothetical protein [Rhodobacterales bacterium HKCCE3408]
MIRAALLPVLMAQPVAAEPWDCAFTVACPVGGDCTETDYAAQIQPADNEGRLFLWTATDTIPADRLTPRGVVPAAYSGPGFIVTIEADTTAALTEGEPPVTYYGTCEAR